MLEYGLTLRSAIQSAQQIRQWTSDPRARAEAVRLIRVLEVCADEQAGERLNRCEICGCRLPPMRYRASKNERCVGCQQVGPF